MKRFRNLFGRAGSEPEVKPDAFNAAQRLFASFSLYVSPLGYLQGPGPGAERAKKREDNARRPGDDRLTRRERFAQHNREVSTRQVRRARLRRDAKALLAEMKRGMKNPAALAQ